MVNTNVIISVSAVLVAMLLTIVSLMRQDGDPTDNYSVSVTGSIEREGTSYPADMYFCTGDDCQFYGGVPEGQFTAGYFALVGINDGAKSYVTEHSIGKTFVYDSSGNLLDCQDGEKLNKQEVSQKMSIAKEGGSYSGYKMTNYVTNANPSTESPTVVGFGVPTVDACKAIWKAQSDAIVNAVDDDIDEDEDEEDESRNLMSWNDDHKVKIDGKTMAHFASWAYSGDGLKKKSRTKKFTKIKTCSSKNGKARFARDRPTVVLAFAGTDDFDDIKQDLDTKVTNIETFNGAKTYARGFYQYTLDLMDCVNEKIASLESINQKLDYVTGHSLGGAASVIFLDLSGSSAVAVTFGQPAHREVKLATATCENNVRRFYNRFDPVASALMGAALDLSFDSNTAYKVFSKGSGCYSDWKIGGICYWEKDRKFFREESSCGRHSTGCFLLFDCYFNLNYHNMGEYLEHPIGIRV